MFKKKFVSLLCNYKGMEVCAGKGQSNAPSFPKHCSKELKAVLQGVQSSVPADNIPDSSERYPNNT